MTLETFISSYIETMLWSTTNDRGVYLDTEGYTADDLASDTLEDITRECTKFYNAHRELWLVDNDDKHAGHDFWLTRNGHGAGFWDGDYQNGDALTKHAKQAGECWPYVGDDNLIYLA